MSWTPVSERTPEQSKLVLVVVGGYVRVGCLRNKSFHKHPERVADWQILAGCVCNNVTHWMPLPEPPEAE